MSGGAVRGGRAYLEVFLKDQVSAGLRRVSQRLRNVSSVLRSVGSQLLGVGLGIAAPLAIAATTFASFDDAMRSVGAVTSSTQSQLASMTAVAKDLGATTSFTAVQVASLMTELGRAGFNPSQIEDMTGAVLNLSRATGTEAPASANIMAAAIRQFGLAAGDATRIADVMTATANKTFNSVEQLGDALTYAGPVAKQFNMSFEDTLAVLGGLGNVGIQASSAGTALRRLLTLTGADAQRLKGIFGVSFVDAAGNARPLVQVLGEVNRATAGLGTAARAAKFNEAFGLLGITASGVISESTADIAGLAEELRNAEGTAARTAAEMDAGLGGSLRILMSSAEGVALAVGEAMAPALSTVADFAITALGGMKSFVEENKSLVVVVATVAGGLIAGGSLLLTLGAAAGVASFAIGGLATITGVLGTAFGTLVAIVSSPIALIIAGAIAAGMAWVYFRDEITGAIGSASDILNGFSGQVSAWFGQIVSEALIAWSGISAALAIGDLQAAWTIAWNTMKLVTLRTFGPLRSAWNEFTTGLMSAMDGAWVAIRQAFNAGSTYIADMVFGLIGHVQSLLESIADYDPTGLAQGLRDAIDVDTDGIRKVLQEDAGRVDVKLQTDREKRDAERGADLARQQAELAAAIAEAESAIKTTRDNAVAKAIADQEALQPTTDANEPAPDPIDQVNQQAKDFAKGDNTKKAFGGDVASTASSAVAALLAAGTGGTAKVEERVADATEKTADNTEKTKNLTEGIAANVGRLGTVG